MTSIPTPSPLPRDLPDGVDSPEEMGDIFDAPSRQEREMYQDHMTDRELSAEHRSHRGLGFQEGWTRAYYLITNSLAAKAWSTGESARIQNVKAQEPLS